MSHGARLTMGAPQVMPEASSPPTATPPSNPTFVCLSMQDLLYAF